jgi:hypothetical protein
MQEFHVRRPVAVQNHDSRYSQWRSSAVKLAVFWYVNLESTVVHSLCMLMMHPEIGKD